MTAPRLVPEDSEGVWPVNFGKANAAGRRSAEMQRLSKAIQRTFNVVEIHHARPALLG